MSEFYEELAEVAEELIQEFGFTAYLVQPGVPTGPEYDPNPSEPLLLEIDVVETGYSLKNRNSQSLVQQGDKLGIISTRTGHVPDKTKHKIRIDGVDYTFIDVAPLKPGPITMLYEFHARQ